MSRARRQQKKRARRWKLEVRDTLFGWRASWWLNGTERHPALHFPKVERRMTHSVTGRLLWESPELQRLPPRAEVGRMVQRALDNGARVAVASFNVNWAQLEARVAARATR